MRFSPSSVGLCLGVAVVVTSVAPALADAPLLDYDVTEIDSPNRRFFAKAAPDESSTSVVRRERQGPGISLWTMPGWSPVSFLSDDGEYLAIGYAGVYLLPLNYKPDDVMVSFYKRGKLVRAVRLNEIISDLRNLERGNSHYGWGMNVGFSGLHQFLVETAEPGHQRRLVFDVTTGTLLGSTPSPPAQLDLPRKTRRTPKATSGAR